MEALKTLLSHGSVWNWKPYGGVEERVQASLFGSKADGSSVTCPAVKGYKENSVVLSSLWRYDFVRCICVGCITRRHVLAPFRSIYLFSL